MLLSWYLISDQFNAGINACFTLLFDLNSPDTISVLETPSASFDALLQQFILERFASNPLCIVDYAYYVLSKAQPPANFEMWLLRSIIKSLYPHLTSDQQQQFSALVYALENKQDRAYSLSGLLPYLDSTQRQVAVQTALDAASDPDEPLDMFLLRNLIEHAPVEVHDMMLDAVLDIVSTKTAKDEDDGRVYYFSNLLKIVDYMGVAAQDDLLSELFDSLSAMFLDSADDYNFSRGWDLVTYFNTLTDSQTRFIIDKVKTARPYLIDPQLALYCALPYLSPFDSVLAIEAVLSIPSVEVRASAMRSSLSLFAEHASWFIQQIASDFIQTEMTRFSLRTLSEFFPFLEGEQKQAASTILFNAALASLDEVDWSFHTLVFPHLNAEQQQVIWHKLHSLADDTRRMLMRFYALFLSETERALYIELLLEQKRWVELYSISRLQIMVGQGNASMLRELLVYMFLGFSGRQDIPVVDVLEALNNFGTGEPKFEVFTPRVFPIEVLQAFGECFLTLSADH